MDEKLKLEVLALAEKSEKTCPSLATVLYTYIGCEATGKEKEFQDICAEVAKTTINSVIKYAEWVENG